MIQFAHPNYLWLLLLLPAYIVWYVYTRRTRYPSMGLSTMAAFKALPTTKKVWVLHALFGLRVIAIGLLIVAFARPQQSIRWTESSTSGTDIILAVDVSSSMLARDFQPNRLEAAKEVASQFIKKRDTDNIGLVTFAAECFTAVPMTTDHAQLINYMNSVDVGLLEDGTAIGDGLATSINRLRDGKAKSKSIILLTDGSHNAGQLAPLDAAKIAAEYGIRVYTIGIGRNGTAPYPQRDAFGRVYEVMLPVQIDEKTLTAMADATGGKYFRATNANVLEEVFEEIDKLEQTQTSVRKFATAEDTYLQWALAAVILLVFELLIRNIFVRHNP